MNRLNSVIKKTIPLKGVVDVRRKPRDQKSKDKHKSIDTSDLTNPSKSIGNKKRGSPLNFAPSVNQEMLSTIDYKKQNKGMQIQDNLF